MSETMRPPGPAGTGHQRVCKTRIVWMDKDEAMKLLACRAALRDCIDALEVAQPYVESSGWTRHRDDEIAQIEAAITNARSALGDEV